MTGNMYTNHKVWFPGKSSQDNSYLMILYDYDSNFILMQAIKIEQKNQWNEYISKNKEY